MARSNLYYAVYDISNDKVRSKVVTALKNAGMVRIQYSVFCGSLNNQQKKDLQATLKTRISTGDSIYLILTCGACVGKITTIGEPFDLDYAANKKEVEII